jgi:N4-gp56 family major capsid protein
MAVENATTTAGLSEELRTYYSMRLIKRLLAKLPLLKDAQKVSIPEGQGKTVQFRQWTTLGLATTALTEGDPPTAQTMGTTEVTATLAEYGGWLKVTKLAIQTFIDKVSKEAERLLAEQGGRSLHKLMVDVVAAGTNVQYVNNAANRAAVLATDTLTVAEVEEAVQQLEDRNVERFPDGYYHMLCSTRQSYDIKRDPDYRELFLGGGESGSGALRRNDLQPFAGVLPLVTTDAPTFASTTTVHRAIVYGPDAFGAIDLAGEDGVPNIDPNTQLGLSLHVIPASSDSKSDPLHQYGTVGWLARFVAKIIDQNRLQAIESGVSS